MLLLTYLFPYSSSLKKHLYNNFGIYTGTKKEIIEYLKKVGELSREEGETTDLISEKMDLISGAVEEAIHIVQKRTLQPEIRRLYQQMVDEKNLSYIGKDGRDYYSREVLEEANKQYMDQMYTENKPRTM